MTTATKLQVEYELGEDQLPLDTLELTDREVLEAFKAEYPEGVMIQAGNAGPVWVNATQLLALSHPDSFGIELLGIANTAANLIRLASDPIWAQEAGTADCEGFVALFTQQARSRAVAKRVNQLHAVRWGVGAKVILANRVQPGTMEFDPAGNWAKRFAADHGCDADYEYLVVVRHPYLMPMIVQCVPSPWVTKNTLLFNEADFRGTNLGDDDGDGVACFWIDSIELALQMRDEIDTVVTEFDPHDLILGVQAHEKSAAMWGENVFADGKTYENKTSMSYKKPVETWITSHIKMGDCANVLTPYAYRISDICGQMSGLGVEGALEAALMGATLEEVFYLGLTGGPEALDEALKTWFGEKMNRAGIATLMSGLRTVVADDLLTTDIKRCLIDGAKINSNRVDIRDPLGAIVKMAWLIGKGRTTTQPALRSEPGALARLEALDEILPDVPQHMADSVIGQLVLYAAQALAPVASYYADSDEPSYDEDVWDDRDDDVRGMADE